LLRQQRVIDLEIDPRVARLAQRLDLAPDGAGDEGAAADFADDEAAAEQLRINPARGRDRDATVIGKIALRRQPIARS
jgi:hypothetical protein